MIVDSNKPAKVAYTFIRRLQKETRVVRNILIHTTYYISSRVILPVAVLLARNGMEWNGIHSFLLPNSGNKEN